MKKNILIISFLSLLIVFAWCSRQDNTQVNNLAELLVRVSNLSQDYNAGKISTQELEKQTLILQEEYSKLTLNDLDSKSQNINQDIQNSFDNINQNIEKNRFWLPIWAQELWLSLPTWLELIKSESRQTYQSIDGYDSVILTYSWDYAMSMQQAEIIASSWNISISPEFKAFLDSIQSSTWTDNTKWIVYTNHSLLDTQIDYLLVISVDENGKLTIEASNYKQMKDRNTN